MKESVRREYSPGVLGRGFSAPHFLWESQGAHRAAGTRLVLFQMRDGLYVSLGTPRIYPRGSGGRAETARLLLSNLIGWSQNLAVCLHEFYRDSDPIRSVSESVDLPRPFSVGGGVGAIPRGRNGYLALTPCHSPLLFQCELSEGKPRMQRDAVSVLVENLEKRERALKVSEVADLFQVSPMTIYRAAKEGSLPSFKVGSSLRFDPKIVTAWLKRQMGVLTPV